MDEVVNITPLGMWYVFTDNGVRLFESRQDNNTGKVGIYDTDVETNIPLPDEAVFNMLLSYKCHYDEY